MILSLLLIASPIDVEYVSRPRTEYTREDKIPGKEVYGFHDLKGALEYKTIHGGVIIKEQDMAIWYVFPKEVGGRFFVAQYKENDA